MMMPHSNKVNDITRKSVQSTEGRDSKIVKGVPSKIPSINKKMKLKNLMMDPLEDLNNAAKAEQEEREKLYKALERQEAL